MTEYFDINSLYPLDQKFKIVRGQSHAEPPVTDVEYAERARLIPLAYPHNSVEYFESHAEFYSEMPVSGDSLAGTRAWQLSLDLYDHLWQLVRA